MPGMSFGGYLCPYCEREYFYEPGFLRHDCEANRKLSRDLERDALIRAALGGAGSTVAGPFVHRVDDDG